MCLLYIIAYRERIIAAVPEVYLHKTFSSDFVLLYARLCTQGLIFEPLMTLYLTDRTTPDEIRRARASGLIFAVKFYPAGATTNSDSGGTIG